MFFGGFFIGYIVSFYIINLNLSLKCIFLYFNFMIKIIINLLIDILVLRIVFSLLQLVILFCVLGQVYYKLEVQNRGKNIEIEDVSLVLLFFN